LGWCDTGGHLNRIVAGQFHDLILSATQREDISVVAGVTLQAIVAAKAVEHVAARAAGQQLWSSRADQNLANG